MTTFGYLHLGTRSIRAGAMLMLLAVGAALAEEPILETPMPKLTRISREGVREPVPISDIGRREILLCERFLRIDAPDEIYAFLAVEGFRGITTDSWEVLLRGDDAELRYIVDGRRDRYFYRALAAPELVRFCSHLNERQVANWANCCIGNIADGTIYEYYHLTKNGGHWLTFSNPPFRTEPDDPMHPNPKEEELRYGDLVLHFRSLVRKGDLKAHYLLSAYMPELQVVFAHPERPVIDVWARRDDVRVLVSDDRYSTMSAWHALVDCKLGPDVDTPEGHPEPVRHDQLPAMVEGAGFLAGGDLGLGVIGSGTPREEPPLTKTSDGCWAIGIRNGDFLYENCRTGRCNTIVTAEGEITGFQYLPTSQRVVLQQEKQRLWGFSEPGDSSPPIRTYVLLDLTTGEAQPVEDCCELPWFSRRSSRQRYQPRTVRAPFLQPTEEPDTVWVLMQSCGDGELAIGKYDVERLSFRHNTYLIDNKVICNGERISSLDVDSGDMWVDLTANRINLIDGGHLLALPLPTDL